MSFKAQLTGFGYGNSMTGEGWPGYVTLDNGGILSVEYETRTYYPVDRYALLTLVGDMEFYADYLITFSEIQPVAMRKSVLDMVKRIREACGEAPDGR